MLIIDFVEVSDEHGPLFQIVVPQFTANIQHVDTALRYMVEQCVTKSRNWKVSSGFRRSDTDWSVPCWTVVRNPVDWLLHLVTCYANEPKVTRLPPGLYQIASRFGQLLMSTKEVEAMQRVLLRFLTHYADYALGSVSDDLFGCTQSIGYMRVEDSVFAMADLLSMYSPMPSHDIAMRTTLALIKNHWAVSNSEAASISRLLNKYCPSYQKVCARILEGESIADLCEY